MTMHRPGREARQQRLATRHKRRRAQDEPWPFEDSDMLRYSRGLRRVAAAALIVVLPALGWAFAECIIVSERADALAVATQPHHTATLVDVNRTGRGGDTYTVEYQGHKYELANGYPLDNTIGAPVQIAFRADDPTWAIGVTEPGYWAPDPGADTFFRTAMVVTGLIFAAWGAWKLLPDMTGN